MKILNLLFSIALCLAACQANPAQAIEVQPVHGIGHDYGTGCTYIDKHSAPVYAYEITNIELSYQGTLLVGIIELNGNWNVQVVDYEDGHRNDALFSKWGVGDLVSFKAKVKDEVLLLSMRKVTEPDDVRPYVIFDFTESPESSLTIVRIADKGANVTLSDGSNWHFSWFNRRSSEHWKEGEPVIVQGALGNNHGSSYEFINLGTLPAKKASCAKADFKGWVH